MKYGGDSIEIEYQNTPQKKATKPARESRGEGFEASGDPPSIQCARILVNAVSSLVHDRDDLVARQKAAQKEEQSYEIQAKVANARVQGLKTKIHAIDWEVNNLM